MKKILLIILSITLLGISYFFVNTLKNTETKNSFAHIQPTQFEKEEGGKAEAKAHTAAQRWQWEYDFIKDPETGLIPEGAVESSLRQSREAPLYDLERDDPNITINARGPNNLGGRTRAIAFDTRNTSIVLAGGVSSGVFRSTNGGSSWTKVSSNSEIHNVTCIVQDTRAGQEDTWYYGTGEASGNSASLGSFAAGSYKGHGVWKSTDNGLTWTVLANTQGSYTSYDSQFDFTHRLVVDPTNGDVYAAASDVIMKSTDGGTNWTQVLGSFGANFYTDIVVTTTGRLYAAIDGGDSNEGVYTSTTGGSGTWTQIADGSAGTPASWASSYGRIVLAIAPSNEDKLFALYDNNTSSSCSGTPAPEADLFVYSQAGGTWTDLSANMPDESGCSNGNDPFACQGGYDLSIAVRPNDENVVFIGGTNAYRSTDGFTSTSNTDRIGGYASAANYAQYANHHPDVHFLTFAPGDNTNLYSGTDGGVARADITVGSGSVAWTELNTDYVTYQYYHVDILPTSGSSVVLGGTQDNGTSESGSGTSHNEIFSGDGVAVGAISYTNSSNFNLVVGSQNGTCWRIVQANFGFNIRPSGTSSSIFVTFFHLDQDNTNILFYCDGQDLYRTRIANTLTSTTVTGDASTGWELMTGVNAAISGNIRSLASCRNDAHGGSAYSSSDANRRLYIGTDNGQLLRLDNPAFVAESTTPTSITPGTAGSGIVSAISVQADDQNTVLATWSSYSDNSVYHTSDANVGSPTWSNVEGNISSQSARSCAIVKGNAQTIYLVGTENGLYCTNTLNAGSTSWSRVGSSSIGYAVCSHMRFRPVDYNLLVGTHGNGMFQLDLSNAVVPVELISFKAKAEERGDQLTWSTASEVDNDYFQIEYSEDGLEYREIARVPGAAQSFEKLDYEFLHQESKPGLNYYHLSQIDLDGKLNDLGIRVVEREADIGFAIEPNPVSEILNLRMEYPTENNGQIDIYNLRGQLVYSEKVWIQAGLANYQFNISELPSGNYLISIQIERKRYTERVVKF